jgi:hypothetical protein
LITQSSPSRTPRVWIALAGAEEGALLASNDGPEVLLLLLLGGEVELPRRSRAEDAVGGGVEAGAVLRELLGDEGACHRVDAGAAVLLRHVHLVEAHLLDHTDEALALLLRQRIGIGVEFVLERADLLADEASHVGDDQPLFLAELQVHQAGSVPASSVCQW